MGSVILWGLAGDYVWPPSSGWSEEMVNARRSHTSTDCNTLTQIPRPRVSLSFHFVKSRHCYVTRYSEVNTFLNVTRSCKLHLLLAVCCVITYEHFPAQVLKHQHMCSSTSTSAQALARVLKHQHKCSSTSMSAQAPAQVLKYQHKCSSTSTSAQVPAQVLKH
jgi:hypothetical protein